MAVFETVGRGSIPWKGTFCWLPNAVDLTLSAVNMIARSSNGRTRHSECRCVGSNPALAA